MNLCPETGKPIVEISHSGIKSFNSCPRRFAYRKILVNADQRDASGIAASVGTAMHEAIQSYFITRDVEKALETLAMHHPIELPQGTDASVYSLEASINTLRHVIRDEEIMDYELVHVERDGKTVPGVELYFVIVIDLGPDCPVIFHLRGYIDLILRHPNNHRIAPIDIKTMTPRALSNAPLKYRYDEQITSYGMPVNALLGEFDEFLVGVMAVSQDDYAPAASLITYLRNQGDVQDYQFQLLDTCRRIAQYYMLDHFPRNSSACITFNRPCNYIEHCHLRTMEEMQNRINPSGKIIHQGREPSAPSIVMRIEGEL